MRFAGVRAAGAALLILTAGCAGSPATAAAKKAAESGLATTVVTVRPQSGKPHRYTVEIARTAAEQSRGLMYRKSMPRDRGMIFPMSPPRFAAFWMENTFIPLDIIFIAPDGRVLNIVQGEPRNRTPVESVGPAAAVLELNAGEASRIGLEPGDAVEVRL